MSFSIKFVRLGFILLRAILCIVCIKKIYHSPFPYHSLKAEVIGGYTSHAVHLLTAAASRFVRRSPSALSD